jgi:hypothetical protein
MKSTIKGFGIVPKELILACKKFGLEFPYDKKNYSEKDYFDFLPEVLIQYEPVNQTLLFTKDRVVDPHDDIFLGMENPGFDLSFFWVLSGDGFFKIDGEPAFKAKKGDWFVFDHKKEHMLFSKKQFLIVSVQLQ